MPRDKLPMKDAQAAIRLGEVQETCDPSVSEWGNLVRVTPGGPLVNT